MKKAVWILPFVLFFTLHIIGIAYSDNIKDGLFEVEKKLAFLSLPIIAASGRALKKNDFDFLKKGFIGSCFIIVIISLAITIISLTSNEPPALLNFDSVTNENFHFLNPTSSSWWEYFSYIQIGSWIKMHPAYFSMYLIFCIVILAQKMLDEMKVNMPGLLVILLFTAFISLLSSRMAIISYFVILFGLPIFNAILKRNYKIAVIPGISMILLSALIWTNPVSRFRLIQEPINTSYNTNQNNKIWTL